MTTSRHSIGPFEVELASYGPRVLGLATEGSPDLFVRLGDQSLPHPAGPYRLGGGHRLWAAPEDPGITYWPDDEPATITQQGAAVRVVGPSHGPFQKEMTLEAMPGRVRVTHRLLNRNDGPLHAAPWAITQLRPGGIAALEIGTAADNEFQAMSSIVTWPYTDLSDPAIEVDGTLMCLTSPPLAPTKFGTPLAGRSIAYLLDGWVFAKSSPPVSRPTDGPTVDRGATGQIYANEDFVELETLGMHERIDPGASVSHVEEWQLVPASGGGRDLADEIDALRWSWTGAE